jgi:DNA-binding response OmpR family regulator
VLAGPLVNVLVADDDPAMRMLVTKVVEQCGHHVVKAATDGQEAWEGFEELRPPVLILDWEMPKLNGLEVCRRVRASEGGEVPFVLMVTARDRSEDLTAVLDAGADDYMSKPVTPDNLRARLRIAERRIDVSAARRRAEEQLRQAQYLAGIGQTSLALQHEINNPLAALLSHASLIEQGMVEDGPEKDESLTTIVVQARRIADVVKRLRQLENPASVEYLGSQRMIDIGAPAEAPKDR